MDTPTSKANRFKNKFQQTKKWSSLPKSPLHLEDESKLRNSNVDIITPRLISWVFILTATKDYESAMKKGLEVGVLCFRASKLEGKTQKNRVLIDTLQGETRWILKDFSIQ